MSLLPRLSGVSRMSLDRQQPGFAVPEAPSSSRRSGGLRGLAVAVLAFTVAAGVMTAPLRAQFPAPARPPKSATEPARPAAAAKPASLPMGRTVLDKHV